MFEYQKKSAAPANTKTADEPKGKTPKNELKKLGFKEGAAALAPKEDGAAKKGGASQSPAASKKGASSAVQAFLAAGFSEEDLEVLAKFWGLSKKATAEKCDTRFEDGTYDTEYVAGRVFKAHETAANSEQCKHN